MHRHVHMVGIGGVGMAAIAKVLLEMGTTVTGSDLVASEVTSDLVRCGARVSIGHKAENVTGAEVVVTSTAITPENPEVVAAKEAGIPVWHRSEMLAEIMQSKTGVAVAGAHGKTTITSMLSWVLHHAGQEPTFCIGGSLPGLGGAHYGSGPLVVVEADESDRSFLRYRPQIAIVTSIEADHLEYYDGDFSKMVATFEQFLNNVTVPDGVAVLCASDPHLAALGERLKCRMVWYGRDLKADYRMEAVQYQAVGTEFDVFEKGEFLGHFKLSVPGYHNVANSLAVIAVCREVGLSAADIARELATFRGARRRFEIISTKQDILIVDDYAHHPSEIKATILAARKGWPQSRVFAVFQPHRYTRTKFLLNEFAQAFGDADRVVLTDVYSPPPDKPIPGVSGAKLAEMVRENIPNTPVDFVPQRCDVADHLMSLVKPGDVILTMGAGDIWKSARELAEKVGA